MNTLKLIKFIISALLIISSFAAVYFGYYAFAEDMAVDSKNIVNSKYESEKNLLVQKIIQEINSSTINASNFSSYADAYLTLDEAEEETDEAKQELINAKFNNIRNYYTIPVTVALGFLGILIIAYIEIMRLQNERSHNREKAKDNLDDLANYGKQLFEDIDKRHFDFMFYKEDLKAVGLTINDENIRNYSEKYFFKNDTTIIYSIELIALLYSLVTKKVEENILQKLIKNYDDSKTPQIIKSLYMKSLSHNFNEYEYFEKIKNISNYDKMDNTYHTVLEDIHFLGNDMGDIILKNDFNVEENENVVNSYLKIIYYLKEFRNILEGSNEDIVFQDKKVDPGLIFRVSPDEVFDLEDKYLLNNIYKDLIQEDYRLFKFKEITLEKISYFSYFIEMCQYSDKNIFKLYSLQNKDYKSKNTLFQFAVRIWFSIEKYDLLYKLYREFYNMHKELTSPKKNNTFTQIKLDFTDSEINLKFYFEDRYILLYIDIIQKYINEVIIDESKFSSFIENIKKIYDTKSSVLLFSRYIIEELNSKYFNIEQKQKVFKIINEYLDEKKGEEINYQINYLKEKINIIEDNNNSEVLLKSRFDYKELESCKILSVEEVEGEKLKNNWKFKMQIIRTDKGVFIDNMPGKNYSKLSFPTEGYDWKKYENKEVLNCISYKILGNTWLNKI